MEIPLPIPVEFNRLSASKTHEKKERASKKKQLRFHGFENAPALIALPLKSGLITQSSSPKFNKTKKNNHKTRYVSLHITDHEGHIGYVKVDAKNLRKFFGISKKKFSKAIKANRGDLTELISNKLIKNTPKNSQAQRLNAIKWYTIAAHKENVAAMNALGKVLQQENPKRSFAWHYRAATQGNAEAMNHLGMCYEKGIGTIQDNDLAYAWYKRASEKGNQDAWLNMERIAHHSQS